MSDRYIAFSSGRTLDPNMGAIGLSSDNIISEGWDQSISVTDDTEDLEDFGISTSDAIELADIMIKRWTEYKSRLLEKR